MNECKDANQTNLAMRGLKWPTGLVNQMALVAALVLFCAFCVALIAQLFFGHRLHLKPPWGCDVVGKGVVLGLLLILLLIRDVRQKYRLLLAATFLAAALALLRGEQLTRFAQSLCWQFCSR